MPVTNAQSSIFLFVPHTKRTPRTAETDVSDKKDLPWKRATKKTQQLHPAPRHKRRAKKRRSLRTSNRVFTQTICAFARAITRVASRKGANSPRLLSYCMYIYIYISRRRGREFRGFVYYSQLDGIVSRSLHSSGRDIAGVRAAERFVSYNNEEAAGMRFVYTLPPSPPSSSARFWPVSWEGICVYIRIGVLTKRQY